MGSALRQETEASAELRSIDADLVATAKELDLERVQAGLDALGIVDPTPASDLASATLSAARGDWLGCGLSLISVIPYVGDAVAKPLKGTKAAARLARLADKLAGLKAMRNKTLKARESAAGRVRELRDAAKRKRLDAVRQACPDVNPFGTNVPRSGTWNGQRGNSVWYPGNDSRNRKKIEKITGGKPIRFKEGYPDFSPYSYKGPPGTGTVEIHMTGHRDVDELAANRAARFDVTPEGHTWHHKEDGKTMELIPSDLHCNVPHSGGASLVEDKRYEMTAQFIETKAPTSRQAINAVEAELGIDLPAEYVQHLLIHNGGSPKPNTFAYRGHGGKTVRDSVAWFFNVGPYEHENLLEHWRDYERRVPRDTVPIARDSFGSLILLGVAGKRRGEVLFWDWEGEAPEGDVAWERNVYPLADSLKAFLDMLKPL